MNKMEVVALGKWCQAAFPQQKWDQYTPDVWADLLEDYSAEDAKDAAKALATKQPFIALSDLIGQIKLIRRKRFDGVNPDVLGAGAPADDIGAYLEAVKSDVKAIGDGTAIPDVEAGEVRPVAALLGSSGIGRRAIGGRRDH